MRDEKLAGKVVHVLFYDHEKVSQCTTVTAKQNWPCEVWGMISDMDETYFYIHWWHCMNDDDEAITEDDEVIKVCKSDIIFMEEYCRTREIKRYCATGTIH